MSVQALDCALILTHRDLDGAEVRLIGRPVDIDLIGDLLVGSADAVEDESLTGSAVLYVVGEARSAPFEESLVLEFAVSTVNPYTGLRARVNEACRAVIAYA